MKNTFSKIFALQVARKIAPCDMALKCTCNHLGFCLCVMFSTFRDEMPYTEINFIFSEINFIFMVFLAVKDAGTDVI